MGHSKENHKAGKKASRKFLCGPCSQGFVLPLEEESQNMFGLQNSDCKNLQPPAQRLPWFSPSSALKGAVGSAETEINHGFVYYSLLFASLRAEISSKPINVKTESETLLSIIFSIRNGTAAPLEHG